MANKKVTVASIGIAFFDVVMDETAVAGYVTQAKSDGYYYNSDPDTGIEFYLPFNNSFVKVVSEE